MDNPATVRNPLPQFLTGSSTLLASTAAKLLVATNSGASGNNLAIIAGSDEYLGTMTHISNANVNLNTRFTTAANTEGGNAGGTAATDNAVPYYWSNGNTLNDNTSGRLFDITAKATPSTNWIIGGDKVEAIMQFKLAAAADWTNDRAVLALCQKTAGATLPSALVITSGVAGTGTACTGAFSWVPFAEDFNVVTGYTSRTTRNCRFCDAAFDTNKVQLHLKEYSPPATPDRKLTGMTVWAQATTGVSLLTIDSGKTLTAQNPVEVGSGGCGKSGQDMKLDSKGQSFEFSMKSPVDLAGEQHIIWESTARNFNVASLPAGSITCTCGTYTWAGSFTKDSSKRFRLTLPTAATAGVTNSQVVCAKGDVVCKARVWSTTATEVDDMDDGQCFACDKANGACTIAESKTAAKGVVKAADAVKFTLKQKATKSTAVLSIKDVVFQPNSQTVTQGRMYFKPSTTMSLYATSTIEYTFGAQNFQAGSAVPICQVFTSNGAQPSTTPSDLVNNCVVSSAKVTVTMAKDSTANFHVQLVGMGAWGAAANNKVTGAVKNFATEVETTDSDATKQYTLAVVGTTATSANLPTSTMTVTVSRTLVNVMDIGMIEFTVTPKGADFGANGLMFISFPTYYNPTIGCMMRCSTYDATAKADGERLYCKVAWDYTLMIMGPSTAQKKDAAFVIRVYGVQMNSHSAAGSFGVGLTNATYWASHSHLVEFKAAADTTTGVWGGVLPITVTAATVSS